MIARSFDTDDTALDMNATTVVATRFRDRPGRFMCQPARMLLLHTFHNGLLASSSAQDQR